MVPISAPGIVVRATVSASLPLDPPPSICPSFGLNLSSPALPKPESVARKCRVVPLGRINSSNRRPIWARPLTCPGRITSRHRAPNGTALGNDDVVPHGDGIDGFAIDGLADEGRFGVDGVHRGSSGSSYPRAPRSSSCPPLQVSLRARPGRWRAGVAVSPGLRVAVEPPGPQALPGFGQNPEVRVPASRVKG